MKTLVEQIAKSLVNNPDQVSVTINGVALGGGLELALSTHIRVAERSAYYALPEGSRGIFVGGSGSARIPRLIGVARMSDLMLTGRRVAADEALRLGLATRVVPDADVYSTAVEMASQFAAGPAIALRAAKQAPQVPSPNTAASQRQSENARA